MARNVCKASVLCDVDGDRMNRADLQNDSSLFITFCYEGSEMEE